MNDQCQYLAHSANGDGDGVCECVSEHLRLVAKRTADFAAVFGARLQGSATGLAHDVGKYADQFKRRLENPRAEPSRDHWSIGSLILAHKYRAAGIAAALAAQGHHAGLQQLVSSENLRTSVLDLIQQDKKEDESAKRLTEADVSLLWPRFKADGLELPDSIDGLRMSREYPAADMVDVRMLFSALVDADFIETEAHFSGDSSVRKRYRPAGPPLEAERSLEALLREVTTLAKKECSSEIREMRSQLLECCRDAGRQERGIFTLSAPTGTGKTLAMLAFALEHAIAHNLSRIVVVMPFLTIIEQTARIYRDLFSEKNGFSAAYVIEDHSLDAERTPAGQVSDAVDPIVRCRRLLAENWDAPIVLTTSVQCLESIMSNRPRACRKLHRLANSVLLFDEVQTLPPRLAVPTLATLSRICDQTGPFRSSLVFATATQPAFDHLDRRVKEFVPTGWTSREIAVNSDSMFDLAAGRVQIRWRHRDPVSIEQLASELAEERNRQVLCIVNLTRHARTLARRLAEAAPKVFHLSTRMCPAHRIEVLGTVRDRLANNMPVRLVATQCVEAGVDLDFPRVYRAIAPIEAIAQAAGRCNRNGRRPRSESEVIVFRLEDTKAEYPPGYGEAIQATRAFLELLKRQGVDLDRSNVFQPDRLRMYFRLFYDLTGRTTGDRADEKLLMDAVRGGDFVEVASQYKLIPNDQITVLVPYHKGTFEQLTRDITAAERSPGWVKSWISRARPHAVGINRLARDDIRWSYLEPIYFSRKKERQGLEVDWFRCLSIDAYDPILTGLELEWEGII